MVGEGCFERGVDRLRTRVGEKDVVHSGRRELDETTGKFERLRISHLKGRRVVELPDLLPDRVNNPRTGMAGIAAPKAGGPVENGATVIRPIMHVLGRNKKPWVCLEAPVGGIDIQKDSKSFGACAVIALPKLPGRTHKTTRSKP
jgi:hypothetical protein